MVKKRKALLTVLIGLLFVGVSICVISQEASKGPGEEPKKAERLGLKSDTPLLMFAGQTFRVKDVKEMIEHSDISMTDRYSHLSLNHKLAEQIQLADHYMSGNRA